MCLALEAYIVKVFFIMNTFPSKNSKLAKDLSMKSLMELEIESLMLRLDSEKRDADYLDDLCKNLKQQLQAKKKADQAKNPEKNPQIAKIHLLQKQIEYETAQFDALKSENSQIRLEINEMRLETTACKKSLSTLSQKIRDFSTKALHANKINRIKVGLMQKTHGKITEIRSKSVVHKREFGDRIRAISSVISQYDVGGNSHKSVRLEKLLGNIKSCNVNKLQLELQSHWVQLVKSKKKELDVYKRHIFKLKEGFEEIHNAIGVMKIGDLVSAFIKNEERNSAMYLYLNTLSGEIDELEVLLRENLGKVEELKYYQFDEEKQRERLRNVKKKNDEIQENIKVCNEKSWKIEGSLKKTTSFLKNIIGKLLPLNETPLILDPAQPSIQNLILTVDNMIEHLKAVLTIAQHKPLTFIPPSPDLSFNQISQILDQKDLYLDPELDESKTPMQMQDFIAKAQKLLSELPLSN